ncbi:hypothetical protein [Asaia sp. As-1742]|uniref:hypothetical protein n=1 Tax=Asaia sp. As-1742 TaxID=2608325 RepID=UPI00141DF79E|nr:hypothetical protein [Asaia sp. As-1742]NIE81641.1 hypothetical protein [Asaia sp. As-1742]
MPHFSQKSYFAPPQTNFAEEDYALYSLDKYLPMNAVETMLITKSFRSIYSHKILETFSPKKYVARGKEKILLRDREILLRISEFDMHADILTSLSMVPNGPTGIYGIVTMYMSFCRKYIDDIPIFTDEQVVSICNSVQKQAKILYENKYRYDLRYVNAYDITLTMCSVFILYAPRFSISGFLTFFFNASIFCMLHLQPMLPIATLLGQNLKTSKLAAQNAVYSQNTREIVNLLLEKRHVLLFENNSSK